MDGFTFLSNYSGIPDAFTTIYKNELITLLINCLKCMRFFYLRNVQNMKTVQNSFPFTVKKGPKISSVIFFSYTTNNLNANSLNSDQIAPYWSNDSHANSLLSFKPFCTNTDPNSKECKRL